MVYYRLCKSSISLDHVQICVSHLLWTLQQWVVSLCSPRAVVKCIHTYSLSAFSSLSPIPFSNTIFTLHHFASSVCSA